MLKNRKIFENLRKVQENSEYFGKIQKNSEKFRKNQKYSEKFGKNQKYSAKKLQERKNYDRLIIIQDKMFIQAELLPKI